MKRIPRLPLALSLTLMVASLLAAAAALLVTPITPRVTTSGTATIGGPFSLVATNGEDITDQTYRGKWQLIFFGYTYCPDACPTTLANISVALEKLGADAGKLTPLFVTIDPQRDTREVMADYLQSFDSRIVGLTGSQAQVDQIVREYRAYAAQQKSETGGDDYLFAHTAYIYLMSPRGIFVNVIEGSEPGEKIATWLRQQMTSTNL
jgi:protein SCO1/2